MQGKNTVFNPTLKEEFWAKHEGGVKAIVLFFVPRKTADEIGNEYGIAKGRIRNFEAL